MRVKYILFSMYASRAVAILVYVTAPKEPWTFYLFAAVLGATSLHISACTLPQLDV